MSLLVLKHLIALHREPRYTTNHSTHISKHIINIDIQAALLNTKNALLEQIPKIGANNSLAVIYKSGGSCRQLEMR